MTEGLNSTNYDIPPELEGLVTVTTLDKIYNWGRRSSIWPMMFGLACCAIEMICTASSRYDLARFGMEIMRPSPRQSDLMIVSGTVTKKMIPITIGETILLSTRPTRNQNLLSGRRRRGAEKAAAANAPATTNAQIRTLPSPVKGTSATIRKTPAKTSPKDRSDPILISVLPPNSDMKPQAPHHCDGRSRSTPSTLENVA